MLISNCSIYYSVCRSLDIHSHVERLRELESCTVIEGHLQLRLFESDDAHILNQLSFPNLTEITDYLIVYRIQHLRFIQFF